ncbi:coiled-coil domain-containing protein 191 isoform X2 [Euwallacea fornicatus]|uniref:coiled-coil domain-containing protein 191 isoform X2 n=1 Tax=Euwallacea fornicatus TaxID=995702 RepID=UPI00338E65FA
MTLFNRELNGTQQNHYETVASLSQGIVALHSELKQSNITPKLSSSNTNLAWHVLQKEDMGGLKYRLLQKFFTEWRRKTLLKTEPGFDAIHENYRTKHKEKLNYFINNLRNHQKEREASTESVVQQNNCENSKPIQCFKNRYKSQRKIINDQRSKIEEQNKIINELKLGIIREDLLKSIENTKIEIRELFNNCSPKLLTKSPLLKAIDDRDKIMILSQKAPKSIQRMQERATERTLYREVILERKRIIEETRQRLLEEAIEKKKVMEEEERKRNLDLINKQRKKDLHLQKIRLEKKKEIQHKFMLAKQFYDRALIKQCFEKLFKNYIKSKENTKLATDFYLNRLKLKVFNTLLGYVESKFKVKYDIADAHYRYIILRRAFDEICDFKTESVRALQVAEDLHDFRLTSNTFIHWHRYVCKQIMLDRKRSEIAMKHNNRRMLFQYFHLWRSLPVVLKLERAKEEKKRKWREKVWEILPDYQIPDE